MLIWILIFSEKKLDLLAYQNTETNNISDKQKGHSQKWSDQLPSVNFNVDFDSFVSAEKH